MTPEKFECWAIVELFGHSKMVGKVSEQTIGGSSMVRVDVPETKAIPGFTRLLNISAIYAINPITEELAKAYAENVNVQPINSFDAREVLRRVEEQKKLTASMEYETGMRQAEEDLKEPHEHDADDLPY